MIAHGSGFIIRHQSGRYFQSMVFSEGFAAGTPTAQIPPIAFAYRLTKNPFAADTVRVREFCGRFFSSDSAWSHVADQFEVVPRPGCGCCGDAYQRAEGAAIWRDGEIYRCDRHRDRNPCAIEGCRRTACAKAGRIGDDQWLCGDHWRQACPPHSALRRTYHRFFRLARRHGWTPELEQRFTRFWSGLVKRARRGGHPDLDITEIEKMFGWAA